MFKIGVGTLVVAEIDNARHCHVDSFGRAESALLQCLGRTDTGSLRKAIEDYRYAYLTTQPKLSREQLSSIFAGKTSAATLAIRCVIVVAHLEISLGLTVLIRIQWSRHI